MNSVFKKANNAYRRIRNGCQVILSPERFDIYSKELYGHHNLSYSQEGEDMILSRLFCDRQDGFYVDVGAHHPQRFSNTYYFYLKGWRGINIDAMPGSMELFRKIRPNDINLELAISDTRQILKYHQFAEPAFNSFSEVISRKRTSPLIATKDVQTYILSEILEQHLYPKQEIDFLSVDVEGLDLAVLRSNNWQKYRPKFVLVEDLDKSPLDRMHESEIAIFLQSKNYELYAKTFLTLIFRDQQMEP